MADAIASDILKIDPHEIAVAKDNSIFTAEVLPWRAQKFKPK